MTAPSEPGTAPADIAWRVADARDAGAIRALVEQGLITPGAELFDARQRFSALVRADGSLSAGPHSGSIHRVGALVQGAESCNGWTFWHHEREGRLAPIDELRGAVRAQMQHLSA